MDKKQLKVILRGQRKRVPQHKQKEYIYIHKNSICRIITEAYELGKEDAKNEPIS